MNDKFTSEMRVFIEKWCLDNKVVFDDNGEVGFGRPCVGITHGNDYLDFYWTEWSDDIDYKVLYSDEEIQAFRKAVPVDAHYKHPCLAVLVHGDDYDEAKFQLFEWITWIAEHKWVPKINTRTNANIIEAIFHGPTIPELRPSEGRWA